MATTCPSEEKTTPSQIQIGILRARAVTWMYLSLKLLAN